MKRYFFIAAMAILAVGCQKTEIQNEVQTPIGFSTEVGKQTKAIVQNGQDGKAAYLTDQPFGVYAYGYQLETVTDESGNQVTQRIANSTSSPMENIEISCNDNSTPTDLTDDVWSATGTVNYYWPNDPRSRLDFYAYSPAQVTSGTAQNKHQQLTGTISHSEKESENDAEYGLILTDYVHSNMYVDFMVATPVIGATYNDQDGQGGTEKGLSSVPLDFKHEMTQINFVVKLDAAETTENGTTTAKNKYPNVDFTVKSIVLNNIVSKATYKYNEPNVATTGLKWTPATTPNTSSYKIYPATTVAYSSQTDYPYSYGAPALTNVTNTQEDTEATVILRTDATSRKTDPADNTKELSTAANPGYKFSTTPVTMIPQAWLTGADVQSFTVTYEISGEGVAKEEIVKTFNFNAATNSAHNWVANKKITYILTIGLKEITFSPVVSNWEELSGSYVDDPSNVD